MLNNQQFDQLSSFSEDVRNHSELFEAPQTFVEKDLQAKDLLKVPTLITLGSFGLVLNGCRHIETINGVNQIVVGRTGDLLDGLVARLLDQSSDAGALADTAADKFGMLAIAAAAWRKDAIPRPVLATVIGKQGLTAGLTAITAARHPDASFRPTKTGKYAMAADNAAFIGFAYANAIKNDRPELVDLQQGAQILGRTAFALGSALSVPTTYEYARRAFDTQ